MKYEANGYKESGKMNFILRVLLVGCLLVLAGCGSGNGAETDPVVLVTTPSVPPATDTPAPEMLASPAPTATSLPASTPTDTPIPPRPTPTSTPLVTVVASASVEPPPPTIETEAPSAELETLADLHLNLQPLSATFDRPLYVTHAGDGSGRMFVVEKGGRVFIVSEGQKVERPFLDITSRVGSVASERGLLSVAFHPDYATNGQFFVNYTDLDGHTIVARYRVADDPDIADPDSEQVVLRIEQPAANHNGGLILFGPDGYLYIGMGDGGQAGDPWGNAQNRGVLLGKMLRIDVDSGDPYGIPPDNPFVDQPDMRGEIWAYGLRNPWRFSFDRATGDLYIADVGQNTYEEVHVQPAGTGSGANYGWDIMEANACFPENVSCDQSGLELPLLYYPHGAGDCSITGGYVYRGETTPLLEGVYFFADYCSGRLWGLRHTDEGWNSRLLLETGLVVSSFGEDEAGEVYLTDLGGGGVYRLTVR